MRLLAVCESPPTVDPHVGNGSTLIASRVLERLPERFDIDLAYFGDRPASPDDGVIARCESSFRLGIRPSWLAHVAQPWTRLPRATWQRATRESRETLRTRAHSADLVYLHGFHTFALADLFDAPLVVNEVDPWSMFWSERAASRKLPARTYDRVQAHRARVLERSTSERASAYVVVNHADASALTRQLNRPVTAIPNGVENRPARAQHAEREAGLLVFVGSLDYAPNIEAAERLCHEVLPVVRQHAPQAHVLLAGRRPGPEVQRLAGAHVDVLGPVGSVSDLFARGALAVYVGTTGRGTKNTVFEALADGCPVVASSESARGIPEENPVVSGSGTTEIAEHVISLLNDDRRRALLSAESIAFASDLPSWDDVAARYTDVFESTLEAIG